MTIFSLVIKSKYVYNNSCIDNQMAEQTYDVMISSKEYNELRNYKKEHAQFAEKFRTITQKLEKAEDDLNTIQLQFNKKQAENSYLLQQIHNIMKLEMVEVPTTLQTGKSVSFEVLGQSMFQPEKAQERKFNIEIQQLNKKYSSVIEKIAVFSKQQQSKDDQIIELNRVILQKNQTIAKLQGISQEVGDKKVKELIQFEKNKHQNKIKELSDEIELYKATQPQKDAQAKKNMAENADLKKEVKTNRVLIQKHKQENSKLTGLLKDFSDRTKTLEKEVDSLKKKGGNQQPKIETIIRIKALIDEHIREVEKNLKSIQGLDQGQIINLVRLEMKELVEYISKSIQNKK